MRPALLAAATLLTACQAPEEATKAAPTNAVEADPVPTASTVESDDAEASGWHLQSSGAGMALALLPAQGNATIRLFCPAGKKQLLVNVPAFAPVASEERLSFGGGSDSVALVADAKGDAQRGGVSATGAVPDMLAAFLGGALSASYGKQRSGPHPAPPASLARAFVAACSGTADAAEIAAAAAAAKPVTNASSACLLQGAERLSFARLRAVGTEPFWGARIEGRCVNYSHPDDQAGTRIWTHYDKRPDGGTWSGALGGKPFELRTRAKPGCSDGMSDKSYPMAVELIVDGEKRTGCAEPV